MISVEQRKRAQELIERPSESLNVELKTWIDPDSQEGQSKLIQSLFALRNQNGEFLIIGFNNETRNAEKCTLQSAIRQAFHPDSVQALVTCYASESFPIEIEYPELNGQEYPVIIVPPGVKTPVAIKSDLKIGDKTKLAINDLYVRTLHTNNTVSSAKIPWKDWPRIMEICFDNREADVGRFLRRHLNGLTGEHARTLIEQMQGGLQAPNSGQQLLEKFLDAGLRRFGEVSKERKAEIPDHGAWEVALILDSNAIPRHSLDRDFLRLLDSTNPQYTGWPVFLASIDFGDPSMRPYINHGAWEEFIFEDSSVNRDWGLSRICDFLVFRPEGRFYHRRTHQEDARMASNTERPMTKLDFSLPVYRTAEALAVGISFGTALGFSTQSTKLQFAFRWTKLKGRQLVSWDILRHFWSKGPAYQDTVVSYVDVPLDTPLSAIGSFVSAAVQPLFSVFDGYSMPASTVEALTRQLIERKL